LLRQCGLEDDCGFAKWHGRSPNRLANRFRIGGVVLIAIDVRLHVLHRHQSHLVAKRA
jgi:hypothetical protein